MSETSNTPGSSPASGRAKLEASQKLDFELHVALIMRTDGVAKAKALMRAWIEGPAGLQQRLAPTVPPAKG